MLVNTLDGGSTTGAAAGAAHVFTTPSMSAVNSCLPSAAKRAEMIGRECPLMRGPAVPDSAAHSCKLLPTGTEALRANEIQLPSGLNTGRDHTLAMPFSSAIDQSRLP